MSEAEQQIQNKNDDGDDGDGVSAGVEAQGIDTETGLPYEDEARAMGWVPTEDFRGDPDKHVSAEKFVERGRSSMPLMRANNAKLERDMANMTALVKDMRSSHEQALTDQHSRLVSEYEGRMREAAAEGDMEAYDAASKQRDNVKPVETSPAPQNNNAEAQFAADNAWYGADIAMTSTADAISAEVGRAHPEYTLEQNLAITKTRTEADFAHKLKPNNSQRRTAPSAVEGARRGPAKKGARTFDSLPEDAKSAFAMFARRKVFTNDDAGKKAYLANYKD